MADHKSLDTNRPIEVLGRVPAVQRVRREGLRPSTVHARRLQQFNVQRHLISRSTLRSLRDEAFQTWRAASAA